MPDTCCCWSDRRCCCNISAAVNVASVSIGCGCCCGAASGGGESEPEAVAADIDTVGLVVTWPVISGLWLRLFDLSLSRLSVLAFILSAGGKGSSSRLPASAAPAAESFGAGDCIGVDADAGEMQDIDDDDAIDDDADVFVGLLVFIVAEFKEPNFTVDFGATFGDDVVLISASASVSVSVSATAPSLGPSPCPSFRRSSLLLSTADS